jgi:opacity protein-like surface antigen
MSRFTPAAILLALLAVPLATPAMAQSDAEKGPYVVARVGGTIDAEQKIDDISDIFQDKTKHKAGLTGQIGGGYDFGLFRIEQTIGYSSADLDQKKADVDGFSADGRSKMFSMSVAGYLDIPVSNVIVPYIGGGVGGARVDSRLSRVDGATGASSSYSGKDWGLLMHADAGVGVRVAPKTIVELGGRYTRVSGLKFDGVSDGVGTSFTPKMSSISATLGLRYMF